MVATNFKYILWLKLQYIRQERNFDIQNVTLKNAQVCEGTPNKLGSVNSHPEQMTLPSPNDATHQSKTHHVMKAGGVNSSGIVVVVVANECIIFNINFTQDKEHFLYNCL